MLRKKGNLFYGGLALMAIGLPVSEFLMSISIFIIAIAWIVNGPKKQQWNDFKSNKLAWSGVVLFLVPFISLIWTNNYDYSLNDLRIKLPLLLVPFFISSYSISKKQFHILLGLLVGSTFVGSIIVFINYYVNMEGNLENIRDVSIFISHIRFSLIIDISIFLLVYAAFQWKNKYSFIAILMAIWFVYFIFFLGSGNGFIGLLTVIVFIIILLLKKNPNKKLSYSIIGIFAAYCIYILYLTFISYQSHFVAKDDPYNRQEANKEKRYYSLPDDFQLENGYFIWRNIANKEIRQEWREVSSTEFFKVDRKGQPIQGTIIRYLTSKRLSKDSLGIVQLTQDDIKNIENGDFHYKEHGWNSLHLRIDQFFYQLMAFTIKGDPSNKPFLQRIFYWKAALHIIKENPIIGVGGDIQTEFNSYFESQASELEAEYWLHSHNQFLTYFVVGGLLGFLAFLWAVFYPLTVYFKSNTILMLAQVVLLISFITEDTLETQPGVTLYVLFLSLAIALFNKKEKLDEVNVFDH